MKRWILNAVEEDQSRAQGYKIESKKKKKKGQVTITQISPITSYFFTSLLLLFLLPSFPLPDNLFFHNYYYILYRNGVWKIDFTFFV